MKGLFILVCLLSASASFAQSIQERHNERVRGVIEAQDEARRTELLANAARNAQMIESRLLATIEGAKVKLARDYRETIVNTETVNSDRSGRKSVFLELSNGVTCGGLVIDYRSYGNALLTCTDGISNRQLSYTIPLSSN